MSVSISYAPLESKQYLDGVTSATVEALEELYGPGPWTLGQPNISDLRAMAAVHRRDPNPFRQLLQVMDRRGGTFVVKAEY